MMRIGILTQPLANNYGGILQNWALQQVLKDMGHEPMTIDIPYKQAVPHADFLRCCWRLAKRLAGDRSIIFLNSRKQLNQAKQPGILQQEFFKKHISLLSVPDGLASDFCQNHPEIEAYIVGSDQVWRKAFSPNFQNYFLDFTQGTDCKKIAYAVSFGKDSIDVKGEDLDKCRYLAQQFDAVSVREKEGLDICTAQLGVSAQWVLDPTLLLSKVDYQEKLLGGIPKISDSERIAAVYILDYDKNKQKVVTKICKLLKLKPVYIGRPTRRGFPGVESWLQTIEESGYVITDSYHGTLFSVIFKKPFTTIMNKGRGGGRFTSIMDALGLSNRLVEETLQPAGLTTIDYDVVEERLALLRRQSKAFLSQSLS